MIPVVTAKEMRAIDDATIRHHVPGLTLMENAGRGVTDEMIKNLKPRKTSHIVIICGKGNNGGDGFVVSRLLKKKGYRISTYLIGRTSEVKGDAEASLKRCKKAGIKIREVDRAGLAVLDKDLGRAHTVIDGIFGTGFAGEPRGLARRGRLPLTSLRG